MRYAAEAADRDSARKLAAQPPRDSRRPTLSLAIVVATIVIVLLVITGGADGTLKDPTTAATPAACTVCVRPRRCWDSSVSDRR